MVDIIDVMLARALTPQGQIDTYAARAGKAVSDANAAVTAAESAVSNIETITEQTNANNEAAAQALQDATDAISAAQTAIDEIEQLDLPAAIGTEINKLNLTLDNVSGSHYAEKTLNLNYSNEELSEILHLCKLYDNSGQNTDGAMTQKAITDAIQAAIDNISIPASSFDFGIENAGQMIKVDANGLATVSDITESDILQLLISAGLYVPKNILMIEIDYENKTIQPSLSERLLSPDNYSMFGARQLCVVNDSGEIISSGSNVVKDGSVGQVMVFQPKFYYHRTIDKVSSLNSGGFAIKKETLYISPTKQPGLKLHPLFIGPNGEELDYVLLSAYEGSVYDTSAGTYDLNGTATYNSSEDKLCSIAGAKPANGARNTFTIYDAQDMAANRGPGWQITNMEYESAQQMLMMVEFLTLNMQSTEMGEGVCRVSSSGSTCNAAITGSTASKINDNYGYANETVIEINGNQTTYSTNGYRSVFYRGVENPYGNMWRFIDNIKVNGSGDKRGGEIVYNNKHTGMYLPNNSNYISSMNYSSTEYDWMYIPAEAVGANSVAPVGDSLWIDDYLNDINLMAAGGNWYYGTEDGIFYYAADKSYETSAKSYGARLMFVPQAKDSIYEANVAVMMKSYSEEGMIIPK